LLTLNAGEMEYGTIYLDADANESTVAVAPEKILSIPPAGAYSAGIQKHN